MCVCGGAGGICVCVGVGVGLGVSVGVRCWEKQVDNNLQSSTTQECRC